MGKILIVDDAKINRMILEQILKDQYEILEAEDGLDAINVFSENKELIDVVLLDAVMPVSSGYDFLAEARRQGWLEHTSVIMVSTDNTEPAVRRALEGGAIDYISRPFSAQTVLRRVEAARRRNVKETQE